MNEPILFVNVTRECNVDCPRCYLSEDVRAKKECIPSEYVEKALKDPVLQNRDCTPIIIWEGGELSLIGENKLREFCEMVKDNLPHAKQTMVTNCLSMPDWLIDISREYFNGRFETTFALGNKFTLSGSSERYTEKFKKSIKKAVDSGINVTINVELNIETYEKGPGALVEIMRETGVKLWEFDISVDFAELLSIPVFNKYSYPLLKGTITYSQFYDYLIELVSNYGSEMQDLGIQSSIYWQAQTLSKSQFFAVKRAQDMFTINPDGNMTLNVLWSDLPQMFVGNIKDKAISDILDHPLRRRHIRWEGVERTKPCTSCEFYHCCRGGPSHAPLYDGISEDCAGGKRLWKFMDEEYKGPYNSEDHMFDPSEISMD